MKRFTFNLTDEGAAALARLPGRDRTDALNRALRLADSHHVAQRTHDQGSVHRARDYPQLGSLPSTGGNRSGQAAGVGVVTLRPPATARRRWGGPDRKAPTRGPASTSEAGPHKP